MKQRLPLISQTKRAREMDTESIFLHQPFAYWQTARIRRPGGHSSPSRSLEIVTWLAAQVAHPTQ